MEVIASFYAIIAKKRNRMLNMSALVFLKATNYYRNDSIIQTIRRKGYLSKLARRFQFILVDLRFPLRSQVFCKPSGFTKNTKTTERMFKT